MYLRQGGLRIDFNSLNKSVDGKGFYISAIKQRINTKCKNKDKKNSKDVCCQRVILLSGTIACLT